MDNSSRTIEPGHRCSDLCPCDGTQYTGTTEFEYPSGYSDECPTCIYLGNLYGPDDFELTEHIGQEHSVIIGFPQAYWFAEIHAEQTATILATINSYNDSGSNYID
jgi:hypothetical protein